MLLAQSLSQQQQTATSWRDRPWYLPELWFAQVLASLERRTVADLKDFGRTHTL